MDNSIALNDGGENVSASSLTSTISDADIKIVGFYDHKKASERYVVAKFSNREWCVPYYYRRTNLFIESAVELAKYLKELKPMLTEKGMASFKSATRKAIPTLFGNATVTIPIFEKLLDDCVEWVCNQDFNNPNSQRRIQDIKETGFTLATKIVAKKTYHMLLPIPWVEAPTYETIPAKVRKDIFRVLKGINAYTGLPSGISVLPDHKFPEIRWTKDTAVSNEGLTDEEMRRKFQLVPEAVNQAKREVCRKCFQTNKRGKFSEINFFYKGTTYWPPDVPKMGKEAEQGCEGCFWYDMEKWRESLNNLITVWS